MRMTSSVATGEEKKTEEGTMMSPPQPESNPVKVADPSEARIPMPATTERGPVVYEAIAGDPMTRCSRGDI
jgi:hypothetical protein